MLSIGEIQSSVIKEEEVESVQKDREIVGLFKRYHEGPADAEEMAATDGFVGLEPELVKIPLNLQERNLLIECELLNTKDPDIENNRNI